MSELEQVLKVDIDGKIKAKIKTEAADDEAADQLQNLYCQLRIKIDPKREELKILEKELKPVEEALLEAIDEASEGHEEGVRKTEEFLLSFSAKGKQTDITDKKKLIEILGLEAFIALASISITDMKKYLTDVQVKQVSKESHKTKRKLTYSAL